MILTGLGRGGSRQIPRFSHIPWLVVFRYQLSLRCITRISAAPSLGSSITFSAISFDFVPPTYGVRVHRCSIRKLRCKRHLWQHPPEAAQALAFDCDSVTHFFQKKPCVAFCVRAGFAGFRLKVGLITEGRGVPWNSFFWANANHQNNLVGAFFVTGWPAGVWSGR